MTMMKLLVGVAAVITLSGCGPKVDHQVVMQYTHDARTGLCFARAVRPNSTYGDWGSTEVSCTESVLSLTNKQPTMDGEKHEL